MDPGWCLDDILAHSPLNSSLEEAVGLNGEKRALVQAESWW